MVWRKQCFNFAILVLIGLCKAVGAESDIQFETIKAKIGPKAITVEIADTPEKRRQGLMDRHQLATDSGMLFVFERARELNFWMKNTYIDLDIGFFNEGLRLLEIKQMNAMKTMMNVKVDFVKSSVPAKYALEMPQGWFEKNKIRPGARLKLEKE